MSLAGGFQNTNWDTYTAKLISAGAKAVGPDPCITYQRAWSTCNLSPAGVLQSPNPLYSLSPFIRRPQSVEKPLKSLTISRYLLWKFMFFSSRQKQPKANTNMWILSQCVFSNISQVQCWSLSENNSKCNLFFSLPTNLLFFNSFFPHIYRFKERIICLWYWHW